MAEGAQFTGSGTGDRYDVFHADCPARGVIDHITSKWGIWVLVRLQSEDLRFFELRESILGISEKMLSQTLRALIDDDLLWRRVEPTTPPRVTYGLTEFGREITEPLQELFDRVTTRLGGR
ncbi:winged helix-turn-helix transcriptional regulator [Actinokineospora bangkokensis]|uniref:Transcriptional regulator n=1 Tax=Actinokineospora bangkokensis TaxID=1193682 RepID=A0A1Q9LIE7_9PSEU|nr:helix-turn-helix domain-containing protein [Actinokineospora bangkokensis]OLR91817.1 transcriptional regulator [Actinokineospora bangkokensis]